LNSNKIEFDKTPEVTETKEPTQPEVPPKNPENKQFFNFPVQEHYYYEVGVLIFGIVYIYVYFTGKNKNQEMAKNWFL
jgi:hypothetical protein